jgi:FkbM family methyltransferase
MFERLSAAARENGDAFVPAHTAVWDRAGIQLTLIADRERHAAASIDAPGRGSRQVGSPEPVTSTTLDELVARVERASAAGPGGPGRTVVKLDIEGAEPQALAAAGLLEERDAVLVYEDHGRDRASRNTAMVLERGWSVFWYDPAGRMREIVDPTELTARKRDPDRGYNLFACRRDTPVHALLAGWPSEARASPR